MTEEHVITATEPVYVTYEIEWDGHVDDSIGEDAEIGDPVGWLNAKGDFDCSCGESFDYYHEAEEHLSDVNNEAE